MLSKEQLDAIRGELVFDAGISRLGHWPGMEYRTVIGQLLNTCNELEQQLAEARSELWRLTAKTDKEGVDATS